MRWCVIGDFIVSGFAVVSAFATEKSVVRALEKLAYMVSN